MPLYVFDVREVLSRKVMVKADSMPEAWDEVERMYMESEIVLDAEKDFRDMENHLGGLTRNPFFC